MYTRAQKILGRVHMCIWVVCTKKACFTALKVCLFQQAIMWNFARISIYGTFITTTKMLFRNLSFDQIMVTDQSLIFEPMECRKQEVIFNQ